MNLFRTSATSANRMMNDDNIHPNPSEEPSVQDTLPCFSILYASVTRDKTLLADVYVQPSDDVRSRADCLLQREPATGWVASGNWRSSIKGLRFHVYELSEGDAPLIWTFACVYDSSKIKERRARLFLQKIVVLTELQRYCDEMWRNGDERACQDAWAPFLLQQMKQVTSNTEVFDDSNLEATNQIIKANLIVQNEVKRRLSKKNTRQAQDAGEDKATGCPGEEFSLDTSETTDTTLSDESEPSTVLPVPSSSPPPIHVMKALLKPLSPLSLDPSTLTEEEAAQVIQRHWRGLLLRRQYLNSLGSIMAIQRVARGHACRKDEMLHMRAACCM